MCAGCVMAAMAGASGTRSWLQSVPWLTPARLKALTIALFVVAFLVSSVVLSGSGAAAHAAHVR